MQRFHSKIERIRRGPSASWRHGVAAHLLLILLLPFQTSAQGDAVAPWVGSTLEGKRCEKPRGGVGGRGPHDYTSYRGGDLALVERFHFSQEVEQLVRGNNNASPIPDIAFVLQVFPNHHRALYSAVRFSLSKSADPVVKAQFPAECFLQRAMNFSPHDVVPQVLYGLFLHRLERNDEALSVYSRALDMAPDNVQLHYNLGLLLLDMDRPEQAAEHARQAYAGGMALPGLRRKLARAGIRLEAP